MHKDIAFTEATFWLNRIQNSKFTALITSYLREFSNVSYKIYVKNSAPEFNVINKSIHAW